MSRQLTRGVEVGILLLALVVGALLLRPLVGGADSRAEYLANKNGEALVMALKKFAERNGSVFPETNALRGGKEPDTLIQKGILAKYPENPYSPDGRPMRSVPFGKVSPGDFSYRRLEAATYSFELVVYGKNGPVFKYGID